MDINMPDMDGITATEQLSAEVPTAAVVMMSVQGEADYLRRSMLAGAREFLVKPFSSDELTASIRQVYAREQEKLSRMADHAAAGRGRGDAAAADGGPRPARSSRIFSPKGGVGRTTLAVNLAVAAATELGQNVVARRRLVPVRRRRRPAQPEPARTSRSRTWCPSSRRASPSRSTRSSSPTPPGSGSCSPRPRPEMAELITPTGVKRVLEAPAPDARPRHRRLHVVVQRHRRWRSSTPPTSILTMLSLEITSIKNMRLFLEVAEQLGYERRQGQAGAQPRRLDASASASRMSSTPSAGRSTTRSSATVGASSTR